MIKNISLGKRYFRLNLQWFVIILFFFLLIDWCFNAGLPCSIISFVPCGIRRTRTFKPFGSINIFLQASIVNNLWIIIFMSLKGIKIYFFLTLPELRKTLQTPTYNSHISVCKVKLCMKLILYFYTFVLVKMAEQRAELRKNKSLSLLRTQSFPKFLIKAFHKLV
jgi:hypothetical protein